jgi:hypothetical protein
MALTDVEICSRALNRLGSKGIQSFTEGTDLAISCSTTYPSVLEAELSVYPWRFAMKKAQLSRHADTPANEWKYAYQLPTDRIGPPFALFNSTSSGAIPKHRFEIFSDKIFTNEETVVIDYPFKPTESAFPAYFVEFMVLAMASFLAIPVTDKTTTADFYRGLAYGTPSENGNGGQLARARRADSAQQPPQRIENFDLVDARF